MVLNKMMIVCQEPKSCEFNFNTKVNKNKENNVYSIPHLPWRYNLQSPWRKELSPFCHGDNHMPR